MDTTQYTLYIYFDTKRVRTIATYVLKRKHRVKNFLYLRIGWGDPDHAVIDFTAPTDDANRIWSDLKEEMLMRNVDTDSCELLYEY